MPNKTLQYVHIEQYSLHIRKIKFYSNLTLTIKIQTKKNISPTHAK